MFTPSIYFTEETFGTDSVSGQSHSHSPSMKGKDKDKSRGKISTLLRSGSPPMTSSHSLSQNNSSLSSLNSASYSQLPGMASSSKTKLD